MAKIRTSVAEKIQAQIIKHGLRVERYGQAWPVFGPGVDLIAADLGALTVADLKPEAQQPDHVWTEIVRGSCPAIPRTGN